MRSGGALFATPVTTARDVRSQAILACDPRQDPTRSYSLLRSAGGVSSGRSASLWVLAGVMSDVGGRSRACSVTLCALRRRADGLVTFRRFSRAVLFVG